jgi:hypothetical protein
MQKVINVIALLSGLTSAALIGGSAYVLLNKDALIEQAKTAATKAATEAVAGALPGMIQGAMPKMPSVTGGAIPGGASLPTTTGLPKSPF